MIQMAQEIGILPEDQDYVNPFRLSKPAVDNYPWNPVAN